MSVRQIKAGSTDISIVLRIIDSSDGTPETGVVWNSAGIDLWYRRELAVSVDITEATLAALTTAHTDGGFLHINDGWYRLDLPDAAVADGVTGVQIGGTVTGMVVLAPYIELVDYDPYDGTRLGLTALPNAAADAAGGLPISDAGGLDLDALNTAAVRLTAARAQVLDDWINAGRLDLILDIIAADVVNIDGAAMRGTDSAALASVLGALNDGAAAGDPTAADTVMQYVKQLVNVLVGTAGVGTFPASAAPANAISLSEVIRAIYDDSNELQADWVNAGRLDAILDIIAADVVNIDGSAMRGTDSAALASVATEARLAELDAANLPADLDAVLADTNELQTDDIPGTLVTIAAYLDTEIAAILADTNELQTDDVPTLIAALNDLSAANVNAEVLDVLNTDTFAEPTGVPSATVTLATKIGFLYMALRNQVTVTATKKTFYDDGGAAEWEKDLSDDSTTFTETEANAI